MAKYWLSKYALSKGIFEIEGEEGRYGIRQVGSFHSLFRLGRDVHIERSDALKAAETMRVRKIASVKKQLSRLEKMSFE
jgi:hypothetical protein